MPILLSLRRELAFGSLFSFIGFLVNFLPFHTANSHDHYVCEGHISESESLIPEAESSRVAEDELPMLDEILSVETGISTSQPDAVKNNDGQQPEVNYS